VNGSRRSGGAPLTGAALVTGATAGLGAAFARRLAAEGRDLVLVARDARRLESTAAALRDRYPGAVEVLPADLAAAEGRARVAARIADPARPVDSLVNNAGFTVHPGFPQSSLAEENRMLDVNVRAVLELTYAAVLAMSARGRGEIVNVASVAGLLPRGASSSYAAGKAWVISFSEGLHGRLAARGIRITAVCPGLTRTEFHERAGLDLARSPSWLWMDADRVVAEGLAAARAGRAVSIPGRRNRVLTRLGRGLPRPVVRWAMSRR
jgi:short-subunit dehydrogenase